MKSKIRFEKILLLLILLSSCIIINYADTNGVWHLAKDVRPGVFGLDENANLFNNFTFINKVFFNDYIYYKGIEFDDRYLKRGENVLINNSLIVKGDVIVNNSFIVEKNLNVYGNLTVNDKINVKFICDENGLNCYSLKDEFLNLKKEPVVINKPNSDASIGVCVYNQPRGIINSAWMTSCSIEYGKACYSNKICHKSGTCRYDCQCIEGYTKIEVSEFEQPAAGYSIKKTRYMCVKDNLSLTDTISKDNWAIWKDGRMTPNEVCKSNGYKKFGGSCLIGDEISCIVGMWDNKYNTRDGVIQYLNPQSGELVNCKKNRFYNFESNRCKGFYKFFDDMMIKLSCE